MHYLFWHRPGTAHPADRATECALRVAGRDRRGLPGARKRGRLVIPSTNNSDLTGLATNRLIRQSNRIPGRWPFLGIFNEPVRANTCHPAHGCGAPDVHKLIHLGRYSWHVWAWISGCYCK